MAGKKSIMANGTAERMIFNNQDPIPGQMEVNAAGEVTMGTNFGEAYDKEWALLD